jgi:hypothetical protein
MAKFGLDDTLFARLNASKQSDKDAIKAFGRQLRTQGVTPIPYEDPTAAALAARDRQRRLTRKAAGRDSTIRTSPAGAPYVGTPPSLLGA